MKTGALVFFRLLLAALGAVGAMAFLLAVAAGHGQRFSEAEIAWMERQRAVDGTKCCNEHDVRLGEGVRWRPSRDGFEVWIEGAWRRVPAGRRMAELPGDLSPFGGQALLFYSPSIVGGPPSIWCFRPEPLM